MNMRDKSIDILKGIGILLVIIGHSYGPCRNFIYLFHMPLFFMAAGYCMSSKYSNDICGVLTLICKRLKSLWLPYFLINSIFLLLNNTFIKLNLYTTDKRFLDVPIGNEFGLGIVFDVQELLSRLIHTLLFNRSTQLTGPSWFLEVLFFVTVLYIIIDYTIKKVFPKNKELIFCLHAIISFVIFVIGCTLRNNAFFSKYRASTILVVLLLFEMGGWFRNIKLPIKVQYVFSIVAFVILSVISSYGYVELSENSYTSPVFLVVSSILGWIMIYGLSRWISNSDRLTKTAAILSFYGKNTMPIIFVHCLCFKPITLLQLKLYNLPDYMLAAFPVLYRNGIWWIVYSACSIALSTLIVLFWNKIKIIIMIFWHKNRISN